MYVINSLMMYGPIKATRREDTMKINPRIRGSIRVRAEHYGIRLTFNCFQERIDKRILSFLIYLPVLEQSCEVTVGSFSISKFRMHILLERLPETELGYELVNPLAFWY